MDLITTEQGDNCIDFLQQKRLHKHTLNNILVNVVKTKMASLANDVQKHWEGHLGLDWAFPM